MEMIRVYDYLESISMIRSLFWCVLLKHQLKSESLFWILRYFHLTIRLISFNLKSSQAKCHLKQISKFSK